MDELQLKGKIDKYIETLGATLPVNPVIAQTNEQMMQLSEEGMVKALEAIQEDVLARAMIGFTPKLRQFILQNMSPEQITSLIDHAPPVNEIDEGQIERACIEIKDIIQVLRIRSVAQS